MFDPFSALGALGFITGTLGFIVSTIPKVDEKIRGFREYGKAVRSLSNRLDVAYFDLRAWNIIWVGKEAFSSDFYIYLWGVGGLENVKSRLNDILEEGEEIRTLLYQPGDSLGGLQSSELRYWADFLANDARLDSLPLQRNDSIIRKMIFALVRRDTLKEKIESLENSIKGLRKSTQQNFRLRHDGDPGLKVAGSELRLLDLQLFVDRISNIGYSLYDPLAQSSIFEWAIELGPPRADLPLDLWAEMKQMYINFVVRAKARKGQVKARRLRIHLENLPAQTVVASNLMEQTIEKVFLSHEGLELDSEHSGIFDVLEHPTKRSRALKKMLTDGIFSGEHRKDFELERANLIYGLGHWMVLLWKTPWFSDLCTCGIRCVHLADANTRHSFLPRPDAGHMNRDSDCHPSKLAEHEIELLGVTLAEIALALPISVDVTGYDTRSYVINGESASRERLLGMLKRQFGQNTITKAVSYCLDPDLAVHKYSLPSKYLEQFCRNIVLP